MHRSCKLGFAGASSTHQKAWEGSYIPLDPLFTMASIERHVSRLEAAKAMSRVVLDGRLGPDHPATKTTVDILSSLSAKKSANIQH